jgi:uncharacterized protein YchJ
MKNLKFYSSLMIIASVFCLISCSSGSSSPSEAIIKTYDYVNTNQAKKVAAMYVTKKGEKLSEDEAKKMESIVPMAIEEWNKKDGFKNIEITEETINEDGNSATVKFIINYKNGDTSNEKVKLLKIDNEWLLII